MGWVNAGDTVTSKLAATLFGIADKEAGQRLSVASWERAMEKFKKAEGIDFDGITCVQIVEVIDQIYGDPRVKQWRMEEIMPIARGRLKEGWTEKDVDEVIAYQLKSNDIMKKLMEGRLPGREELEKETRNLNSRKPRVLILLEGR